MDSESKKLKIAEKNDFELLYLLSQRYHSTKFYYI